MPPTTYADDFRCIGSDCEDTCCQGWTVPVDRATWDKYHALPATPLGGKIRASLIAKPEDQATQPVFAILRMNEANQCTLLTPDRLCSVQSQLGEGLLSHACATYPRYVHSIGAIEETALTLSCPEAARLVLLAPDLRMHMGNDAPDGRANYWPVRKIVIDSIRSRAVPLWQRLLLLNRLCRRLDDLPVTESFAAQTEPNSSAQLDVVLRLAGLLLHRSNLRPRFLECIANFTSGIGNGPGATLETLTARYATAHDEHYAPFMGRHPYILENFLINTAIRCQFPFGKQSSTPPNHSREFAQLAAQFVLIRGLLIGVAGHHGADFSAAHVIHTVQAASKHFEHHPDFLNLAVALLAESHMDGPQGLAALLCDSRVDEKDGQTLATPINQSDRPGVHATTQASAPIFAPLTPGGRSASAPVPAAAGPRA